MIRFALLPFVAIALIGGAPETSTPTLTPALIDPALVLPPPPADDSAIAKIERQQLHDIDAVRTPAQFAHANADNALKDVTVFAGAMGPGFDLVRLPATRLLFESVRREEKATANRAKDQFRRNRPWIVDAALHPCSTDDGAQTSYPSGHVTMGFAMAQILARLAPKRADRIMARAADYANSRMVCEMHFATDVAAGEVLGSLIAERLMRQPEFVAKFWQAEAELHAAGLA